MNGFDAPDLEIVGRPQGTDEEYEDEQKGAAGPELFDLPKSEMSNMSATRARVRERD